MAPNFWITVVINTNVETATPMLVTVCEIEIFDDRFPILLKALIILDTRL